MVTLEGFVCSYCGKQHGVNEGSTEMFKDGSVKYGCDFCGKTFIGRED